MNKLPVFTNIVTNVKNYNKGARWLYAELKLHISFLVKSLENSLMRLYEKAHLVVAS